MPLNDIPDPIGAAWLAQTFDVMPIARLPVVSQIGGRRETQIQEGFRQETFQESMRPDNKLVAHLHFHLRHEVAHLEFLARLFAKVGGSDIQAWIDAEPTGQYARRAAFLYEWLTGSMLVPPARLGGNYIDAIDSDKLLTASPDQVVKVSRWRVNDNLPGTREFCPYVVKTDALMKAAAVNVAGLLEELTTEFGEDLLLRAAVWMTLRESKASFFIEGEAEQTTRVQRFADVMARRTGQGDLPLSNKTLAELQREILGDVTSLQRLGVRESPVFVGETLRYQEIVHYIAPPEDELGPMLDGLRTFLERTKGQSPVMRCAVAAFSFVYIHPLADGNGRVHRFLVNDILRRDGVMQEPVILPISAVISDSSERRTYDQVLDRVSKPLMQRVSDQFEFSSTRTTYPDGVVSNFVFHAPEQARPLWRYPDLGPHVVFMANIIARTITEQMRHESRYLCSHLRARQAIKEIVEMPDHQADRVLRSIEQNKGILSGVLAKEIPVLTRSGIWEAITEAIKQVFLEGAPLDNSVLARYHPTKEANA